MGSRSRCVVLVRTYASPSWKRRPDISSTKSRTSEVASSGSRPSGKLPKSKSERKELPSLRPISRVSKHQAHAMVLYKDGETYVLCVHTVPRCAAYTYVCSSSIDTPRAHTTSALLCRIHCSCQQAIWICCTRYVRPTALILHCLHLLTLFSPVLL